jgi:SPP1 family predicted phage head-tail adaptor
MSAGARDRLITIQHASVIQDASGQEIEYWEPFASVWASRKDVRGSERFSSDQRFAARAGVYRMPYLSGLHEEMRIVDDGATYSIIGIADNRRQGWVEVSAEAINPAALP